MEEKGQAPAVGNPCLQPPIQAVEHQPTPHELSNQLVTIVVDIGDTQRIEFGQEGPTYDTSLPVIGRRQLLGRYCARDRAHSSRFMWGSISRTTAPTEIRSRTGQLEPTILPAGAQVALLAEPVDHFGQ